MTPMFCFLPGRTYQARSACDHDCVFTFEVTARSKSFVTLKSSFGVRRRKITVRDGVEQCDPLGQYSMAPIIRANRETV